jgi:chaperonin GroES
LGNEETFVTHYPVKILGKKILVKPCKSAAVSKGGIIIQDAARQFDQEGVVMAIGSEIKEAKPYRKGSKVFIEMYKAAPVRLAGEDCLLVDESAICGVAVGADLFHPIDDRILLKMLPNHGGKIIRPSAYDRDADELLTCEVWACGNGVKLKSGKIAPFEVKTGDLVVIKPTAGRDVQAGDDTFKLVRHHEILATTH